jgi:hypothetical protein
MQIKLKQSLIERSFNGWRYNIMLQKMQSDYEALKQKKDIGFFFTYWLDLQ